MVVTQDQLSADLGEVYDAIDGGETAAIAILERATSLATAAGSSDDSIVRPLADAMIVNQVIGGVDPVNKTIGSLSVGAKDLQSMRNYFQNEAKKAAVLQGISLDGLTIILQDCEQ